jgi:hypothetical protein
MFLVDVNMNAVEPFIFQSWSRSAVAFMVTASLNGDSPRGDWTGHMPGAARPMLKWTTHCGQRVSEKVAAVKRNRLVRSDQSPNLR